MKPPRATKPDPWGQRVVFLGNGIPVRRVPVSLSRRFHQLCMAVAGEVGEEDGLTVAQVGTLAYLYEEPDLGQNELAARLGIDRSNTTLLLDELEQRGLVERRVNEDDRRAKCVRLTAAGTKLRERLRPKGGIANQRILAPLSPKERELFLDLLVKIIEANESLARPGAGRRKAGPGPARDRKEKESN